MGDVDYSDICDLVTPEEISMTDKNGLFDFSQETPYIHTQLCLEQLKSRLINVFVFLNDIANGVRDINYESIESTVREINSYFEESVNIFNDSFKQSESQHSKYVQYIENQRKIGEQADILRSRIEKLQNLRSATSSTVHSSLELLKSFEEARTSGVRVDDAFTLALRLPQRLTLNPLWRPGTDVDADHFEADDEEIIVHSQSTETTHSLSHQPNASVTSQISNAEPKKYRKFSPAEIAAIMKKLTAEERGELLPLIQAFKSGDTRVNISEVLTELEHRISSRS